VTLGATPRFSARGFTNNNITVMRDGIRQNTSAQSARTLDAFMLDRIEVLRGPASVLFGEGAIAGAVNYVSKAPPEDTKFDLVLAAADHGERRVGLGGGGLLADGLAARADASHARSDGFVDRSGFERTALAAALRWSPRADLSVSLNADWTEDAVESYFGTPLVYDGVQLPSGAIVVRTPNLAAGERLVNPRIDPRTRRINYNIADGFSESQYSWIRGLVTWTPAANVEVRIEPYRATQVQDYVNSEGFTFNPVTGLVQRDALGFIGRDDVLVGVRTQARFDTALFTLPLRTVVGLDLARNDQERGTRPLALSAAAVTPAALPLVPDAVPRFASATLQTLPRPEPFARALVETRAVYAESMLTLPGELRVIGGIRFDDITLERTAIAPSTGAPFATGFDPVTGRLGVVWQPLPGTSLYAAWTDAAEPVVQLVSLTATSRDFGLQRGRQYEVGAKWTFWDGRADATLAWYDIRKEDILTSSVVNGVRIQQQIGAQVSQGIEAALVVLPAEGWSLEANLAWTDARFEDFFENLGTGVIAREGNRPDNLPEWSSNLVATRELEGLGGVQLGVRHVGDRFANNANTLTLDAYTLVDAAGWIDFGNARLTLRARNLTDETYADWAVFTNTPFLKLGDPRSFEVSLAWRL